MTPSGGKWVALLVILLVLTTATLSGVASMYRSVNAARDNTALLRYNSRRADCIRDVQADADEEFRREISLFFDARFDPAKVDAVRERMRNQPNWANTVKKVCPPAVDGS
jgi:hypothetical protein